MSEELLKYFKRAFLKRRYRVLVSSIFAILLVWMGVRYISTPFQARQKFLINQNKDSINKSMYVGMGSMPGQENELVVKTQKEYVMSKRLFESVIATLGIKRIKFEEKGLGTLDAFKYKLQTFLFGKSYIKTKKEFTDYQFINFQKNITFSFDSEAVVFNVSYTEDTPQLALKYIDAIKEALLAVNIEFRDAYLSRQTDFLREKIDELRDEISVNIEKLSKIVNKKKFLSSPSLIEEQYKDYLSLQKKVNENNSRMVILASGAKEAKKLLGALRKHRKDQLVSGFKAQSEYLASEIAKFKSLELSNGDKSNNYIKNKVSKLEKMLSDMATADSTKMSLESVTALIAELEKKIIDEENELKTFTLENVALKGQLKAKEKVTNTLPGEQFEVDEIMKEVSNKRVILDDLSEKYFTALMNKEYQSEEIIALDDPEVVDSVRTSKIKILFLGILGLVCLLSLLIPSLDYLRGVVYLPSQVQFNQAEYIGGIPMLNHKNLEYELSTNEDVEILLQELLIKLASQRRNSNKALILTIASAGSGDGKTLTSAALVSKMLQLRKKVLLLDLDTRAHNERRTTTLIEALFARHRKLKLSDFEANKPVAPSVDGKESNLHIFSISSQEERNLENQLTEVLLHKILQSAPDYDYIVIDTPPIYFPETLRIVGLSEAIVMLCPEGDVKIGDIRETVATLQRHKKIDAKMFFAMSKCTSDDLQKRRNYYYRGNKVRAI